MAHEFDLVVIGAGPGGYIAAIRGAQLGLKAACVEKEKMLGGTCLRVGCIPSKALLESSERYDSIKRHAAAHGIKVGSVDLDLPAMMKRKDQVVGALGQGIRALFRKNRVESFIGQGTLAGATSRGGEQLQRVMVRGGAGEGKGDIELVAPRVILATGSDVASMPNCTIDEEYIVSSTGALSFAQVPKTLVVIGAGAIGLELGSVWARLGSRVTVLEYADRALAMMDSELSAQTQKILAAQGLAFQFKTRVQSVTRGGDDCSVAVEGQAPIKAARVLVAVGRRPMFDGLGLEDLNIKKTSKNFVEVDADFRTSAAGVYAIGDLIGGAMLAHKAEEEAVACVEKMVTGYGHVDYHHVPAVVYTDPEVAAVGASEDELRAAGTLYRKGTFPFAANGRARSLGQTDGFVKVLAAKDSDRILGVHMIGPRVGDLIAEAGAAMAFGASSEDVARVCHAHPTLAEGFKEAALAVDGRALNQ